ncbi:hypothetical protein PUN28_007823 [Cardiocondyla obscurior]|uniref:Uncharacterized protein n=1 Tax=Cardiocondyla obscurior TaxID=286306 RepID=A0AAW2FZL2_9HYME
MILLATFVHRRLEAERRRKRKGEPFETVKRALLALEASEKLTSFQSNANSALENCFICALFRRNESNLLKERKKEKILTPPAYFLHI